ncbi:MAG: Trx7/PDZ domain-containing (seleno)protein [Planctomycetota bacterium]|nr:Trx7/PDZ domain-containing (seleno)protein [Planctomycetota bacterium]
MRLLICLLVTLCQVSNVMAQTRDEVVRGDRKKVEAAGFWIYNDLPKAFAEAKRTGKPIVVVLRCLPCHECVKLDDELVDTHPVIRPLLEKFVCARQVSTNGLDLSLFQFDTDQSFGVFFLNADKTIYGRFGTRSHRTEWLGDVSLKGLAKALQKTLDLHDDYDTVKDSLAGKRGQPLEVASPELYPSLKAKFTDKLNYEGDVVKSCIHCHQIGDAQREFYWSAKKPIPDKVLWPYPHPKSIGLTLDPNEMATVKNVKSDSPAAAAGLKSGDVIESFNGQPMLSIADVQWVLHNVDPAGSKVSLSVKRSSRTQDLTLNLEDGWRRSGDLSWRVTSWGLRRIATGGLLLETLPDAARRELRLARDTMALRVKHAGKYGPHGTAHRLGIKQGDIITEFDSRTNLKSEQDLHAYVVTSKKSGDRVSVNVRRGRQELNFKLPIQP